MILLVLSGFGFFLKTRRIRPNIILITIDALRFDHLSCYGYKQLTTPNIDSLSRQGVRFNQAISQSPITAGSVPSLLSSTYPSTNGHDEFSNDPPVLTVYTLPLILKKYGYAIAAFSGHGAIFSSIPGLKRGFDLTSDTLDTPADIITNRALKWLNVKKRGPFFLWVHYFDTHAPYQPHAPYDKLFISAELNPRYINLFRRKFASTGVFSGKTEKNMDEKAVNYCISQYDGELKFVDDQIGVMFNALKKSGLIKNTIIIITADHGENQYDHNKEFGHGLMVYDVLLRVPLIFNCENWLPKNKVFDWQVQLIDIMPTVFDIAKINAGIKFEGNSLLPFILNKKVRVDNYAFSEVRENKVDFLYSIRSKKWKLIEISSPGEHKYELYNLKADPQELHDLSGIQKKQLNVLKTELIKWKKRKKPKSTISGRRSLDEGTKKI